MNHKVLLATTVHGQFPVGYVVSMMKLAVDLAMRKIGFDYAVYDKAYRSLGRTFLVEQAQKRGCSHILFVDADQCDIPSDCVYRWLKLMDNNPEIRVISGLYFNSNGEAQPVVFDFAGDDGSQMVPMYEFKENSLQEVRAIGGGIKLVDLTVYDDIGTPWYEIEGGFGEDIFFSNRCYSNGIKIWLDSSVSIGHYPKFLTIFNEETYKIMRELKVRHWDDVMEHLKQVSHE